MIKLHKITNHPVHIYDEDGDLSPSAFIPFCQFGRNMHFMILQTDLLKMPVCNSFKAKIFYDQLCYEVDVNEFVENESLSSAQVDLGLSFLVDTNFERQYSLEGSKKKKAGSKTLGK